MFENFGMLVQNQLYPLYYPFFISFVLFFIWLLRWKILLCALMHGWWKMSCSLFQFGEVKYFEKSQSEIMIVGILNSMILIVILGDMINYFREGCVNWFGIWNWKIKSKKIWRPKIIYLLVIIVFLSESYHWKFRRLSKYRNWSTTKLNMENFSLYSS